MNDGFSHIIGNDQTITNLRNVCTGYRNGISLRQHFAFVGPPGSGKTTVAKAFANELKIPLVKSLSAVKGMTLDPLFDYCRNHAPREGMWAVIIDEFHILSADNQSRMLTLLEKDGTYTSNKGDVWSFPNIIVIIATTEEKQFFVPGIARRFNWQPMWLPDIDDCITIVQNEAVARNLTIEFDTVAELCRINFSNPGEAISALNTAELLLGANVKLDVDSLASAGWKDVDTGLDSTQQRYLLTVFELCKACNSPSLARIAASMKLRMATIQGIETSMTEYVHTGGTRGRRLTDLGLDVAKRLSD